MTNNIFKNAWRDVESAVPKELLWFLGPIIVIFTLVLTLYTGFQTLLEEYNGFDNFAYLFVVFTLSLTHNIILMSSVFISFLSAGYAHCLTSYVWMKVTKNRNTMKMAEIYLLPAMLVFFASVLLMIFLAKLMFEIPDVGSLIERMSFLSLRK